MFNIAIIGCGVVGSGVADILLEQSPRLSKLFNKNVNLTKIIDLRELKGTPYQDLISANVEEALSDPDINLVVVTIGGLDLAADYCRQALKAGKHVVTSNKEVVAACGPELVTLAFQNKVRFLFEASVGGGIPIIRPLNICLAGNKLRKVQGILNGTTNYMLTGMSCNGSSFEQVLKEAQEKGYAEANPTADVDGHDAARKIAILSSISYGKYVDYSKMQCKGIRNVTSEDFELADKVGYTIKLIAQSNIQEDYEQTGDVYIDVAPALLPYSNILASVNSVYNAVLVNGEYTGDTLMYGKGAGKLPTADAVVGDIIDILGRPTEDSLPDYVFQTANICSPDSQSQKWFVRFKALSQTPALYEDVSCFGKGAYFTGMSSKDIDTGAIITDYLNLKELNDAIPAFQEKANVNVCEYIKIIE